MVSTSDAGFWANRGSASSQTPRIRQKVMRERYSPDGLAASAVTISKPALLRAIAQHAVTEDARDLVYDSGGVLAEVVLHTEDDLDGEVVVENTRGQHHRGDGRESVLELVLQLLLHTVSLHEELEAAGHLLVELPDVRAVEFDAVDVHEGHIVTVSTDGLAGGAAEVFQILWKRSAGQGLIEGEVRLRHGPEVAVQQGTEDRFLVRKVMIDVPLRDVGGLGDVTHAGGAKAAMRKEFQRGVEDHVAAALGALFLVHSWLKMDCL